MDYLLGEIYQELKCINNDMQNFKDIKIRLKEYDFKFEQIQNILEKVMHALTENNRQFEKFEIKKDDDSIQKRNEKQEKKAIIPEFNDYDKIILKNLESRICILEEETQKYTIN